MKKKFLFLIFLSNFLFALEATKITQIATCNTDTCVDVVQSNLKKVDIKSYVFYLDKKKYVYSLYTKCDHLIIKTETKYKDSFIHWITTHEDNIKGIKFKNFRNQ